MFGDEVIAKAEVTEERFVTAGMAKAGSVGPSDGNDDALEVVVAVRHIGDPPVGREPLCERGPLVCGESAADALGDVDLGLRW